MILDSSTRRSSTPMLDIPVLVLGAENDPFVYRGGLEATASAYRAKAEIFPGMTHAMMLDRNWESVAERIATWLDATPASGNAGRRNVWHSTMPSPEVQRNRG